MTRSGLEPETYGLTCRTGFHPPRGVAVWTFPSPSAPAGGEPHVKSLRNPCGFLLIAQSDGLSRPGVPSALRVFQHMVRFYVRPFGRGTPIEVRCSTN